MRGAVRTSGGGKGVSGRGKGPGVDQETGQSSSQLCADQPLPSGRVGAVEWLQTPQRMLRTSPKSKV